MQNASIKIWIYLIDKGKVAYKVWESKEGGRQKILQSLVIWRFRVQKYWKFHLVERVGENILSTSPEEQNKVWTCQEGVGGNEERNSVKENICNYGIRESTMTPKHQTKNTQFTLMCSPLASNLECKSTVQNYSVTFKVKEIAKRRIQHMR